LAILHLKLVVNFRRTTLLELVFVVNVRICMQYRPDSS